MSDKILTGSNMEQVVTDRAVCFLQNTWFISMSCAFIIGGYYYYITKCNYWSRRGIKGVQPVPIFGELYNMLTKDRMLLEIERRQTLGKVYGLVQSGVPRVVVADAEVIRQICIKDFDVFTNHRLNVFANKYEKLFLVWLQNEEWKKVRSALSPMFTSAKIKKMSKFLDACAEDLIANFRSQIENKSGSIEEGTIVNLRETYGLFTMDGIATCGYGLKLKREDEVRDVKGVATRNDFVRYALKVINFDLFRVFMMIALPKRILRFLNFKMNPDETFEPIVRILDRMVKTRRLQNATSTKKYDDMLQLILDAKLDNKIELNEMDRLENHHAGLTQESLSNDQEKLVREVRSKSGSEMTDIEIMASALFLLAAGYETTGTLLSNCTYALAFHPEVQEKLFEQLSQIVEYDVEKNTHHFDYDALTSCQYLDAVISESLRILPPALQTDRVALQDYFIKKYNVQIPEGMGVLLGIYAVHTDPDYWDEPEKFKPERFMPGNREKIVPGSYAPFSLGPRHCIGMRFSLTEAKIGLAKVLMRFRFETAPNTKFPFVPFGKPGIAVNKTPFARVTQRV